jgi:hypothetical protein
MENIESFINEHLNEIVGVKVDGVFYDVTTIDDGVVYCVEDGQMYEFPFEILSSAKFYRLQEII